MDRNAGSGRDEDDLVRRAQSGDTEAFEILYRNHVGRVHALCLRLCRNRAEAEDMTQETFLRAWRKLGTFAGRSALSSWLHRLAVNVVLTHLRSRGASIVFESIEAMPEVVTPSTAHSPPETSVDLERAILSLPDGARMVFVLHDIHGYRHEEIAGMMGIRPGTSKAQLHRARGLIRSAGSDRQSRGAKTG